MLIKYLKEKNKEQFFFFKIFNKHKIEEWYSRDQG